MPELSNGEIVEIFASALEAMAFVALTPPEAPILAPTGAILARIEFAHNGRPGCLEMVAPLEFGRMLVANVFSFETADGAAAPDPTDPLIELLNVTCGVALKRQFGSKGIEMSVPQAAPFDADLQWENFIAQRDCDVLAVDGMILAIRFALEEPCPSR